MGKVLSRLFGFVLIVCVVSGITYISLLGENDRAASTVKSYFNNIAGKHYDANTNLCSRRFNRRFNNLNDPITYQFSLETALLNHFGLINTAQYATETRREEFWVPYLKTDTLHISIAIHPKGSNSILANLFQSDGKPYLNGFVTLVREDGRWKIDFIDTQSQAISRDFQKTKVSMQNSKYMRQTANGIILKENTITFSKMDPIQKRILTFNLNKALTLLKNQN